LPVPVLTNTNLSGEQAATVESSIRDEGIDSGALMLIDDADAYFFGEAKASAGSTTDCAVAAAGAGAESVVSSASSSDLLPEYAARSRWIC